MMLEVPGAAMLEAVNLTKRYEDGVLALDHVSFTVKPGQIFAMLGANGAGKTTAINLFLNFIFFSISTCTNEAAGDTKKLIRYTC